MPGRPFSSSGTIVFAVLLLSITGLSDPLAPAMAQEMIYDELHRMVPFDPAVAAVFGDVDGDGDLDAFIRNMQEGRCQNRLFLNDGTGVFIDATHQIPVYDDYTYAVALGDVDGDGDLDAFIGNNQPTGAQNRLYLNDGAGFFSDATSQIPSDDDNTWAVALGDVDGDGDLDAFIGNAYYDDYHPDRQNRLYLNNGSGVFSDATSRIPVDTDDTGEVALGDVDGDGDLDVFLGNRRQNRLYLNDGSGFFCDATNQIPADDDGTYAVALGDVDEDGDLDAFIGHSPGNRLYLNDGAGFFADASNQIPDDSIGTPSLGDVDGDGDLDSFIGGYTQSRLYLNDGAGWFTDVTATVPIDFDHTNAVVLGDADGDGDLDAFFGNGGIRLYLNNGTGLFTDAKDQIPTQGHYSEDLALGDVDNDGDLDVLSGDMFTQTRLYLNDGAGVFSDATSQLPVDDDDTLAVALGDVDGDDDLDAFIGNKWYSPDRLYLNDGAGFFSDASTQLPEEYVDTLTIALGDVDGDGDLDAFFGTSAHDKNRLYLNDGAGFFSISAGKIPSSIRHCCDADFGDVDDDGDLDIFIGNYLQNQLLLNDGTGRFSVALDQIPSDDDYTWSVSLGDVDGDGDLDALMANEWEHNRLYLNDGAGVFSDATSRILEEDDESHSVALGDVDGDGDLDAFIGNDDQPNRLYTNLTRQLAWPAIPRIGKPLSMDLYGPANGTYILAASRAQDSVPMPPYGILRIDLGQVFFQGKGGLDSDGRASVDFDVPPNPNLNGMSFYFQALVGPPDKLTNLEIVTITNL